MDVASVGMWKEIQKDREKFWRFIRFRWVQEMRPGSRRIIGVELSSLPHKVECISIYLSVINKQRFIASNDDNNGGGLWAPTISRNLIDWEIKDWMRLMNRIQDFGLKPEERDVWEWIINTKENYSIKSFYKGLEKKLCSIIFLKRPLDLKNPFKGNFYVDLIYG